MVCVWGDTAESVGVMGWYYRVCKKYQQFRGSTVPFYCIVEYYPKGGNIRTPLWSSKPETPISDSKKELIKMLELMLKDAKKYKTLVDMRAPYKG